VNGITSGTALWYASRATGVVAMVLLTASMVLGMLVNRRGQLPGLPRFGATSLHRSLSLLAAVFVVVHVITAVTDPFVTIGWAATVVPFVSPYEPLWLGLGAVSGDLMLALIVTSLLRRHLGRRTWRAVHWVAYLSWPVALAHSIGASTDLQGGGLLCIPVGCGAAVAAALAWRLSRARAATPVARRAAATLAQASGPPPGPPAPGQPGRRLDQAGAR
jgi:sulfoxide reductase heme-binding subunit YedZ